MNTLFTGIYELLCGKNPDIPDYRETIYRSVGLLTLVMAIVIGLLFYLVLGRWRNVWYTRIHWVLTVIIAALIGFGLAYGIAKGIIGSADAYLTQFALLNGVLLAVYLILLSLFFKRFSIYSKRTPF
ncbi:hypothetical protein BEL04_08410 [Mucilaginibacter sp. PPCGB 2223]|uniref:hypothetical protein n=1 Tax=Mucilaginibacter sp. PPCGB 2223 TaxID=1886027 RepID=UPI0008272064|nr:hypothetical protein [Mucilaginibacter sp. PPCGB 2223]OCX54270.1 hypothetical protein BEL04_08410 [Mucilaginibacter sp. PPCGB 2223]